MKIPRILQKSERISRKQNIINWFIFFGVLAFLAYTIPMWFIGNGVAQIAQTPEEKYYAEKVLEYRTQYNKENGFKKPLNMRVVKVESNFNEEANATYKYEKYCSSIPRQHFDELFNEVYSKTFYVHEYTWFGDHQTKIVLGCALYKVGV